MATRTTYTNPINHPMLTKVGKSEKGFTLIQMLLVVGIIVALAEVVVPTVNKFSGRSSYPDVVRPVLIAMDSLARLGEKGAKSAEFAAVQSAIDNMLVDNKMAAVTANETAAKITETTDFGGGQLIASYIGDPSSSYCYTWDGTGKVLTQAAC